MVFKRSACKYLKIPRYATAQVELAYIKIDLDMGPGKYLSGSSGAKEPRSKEADFDIKRNISKGSPSSMPNTPIFHAGKSTKQPTMKAESVYPEDIQHALDELQKFTEMVIHTECHNCQNPIMHDFTVSRYFQRWLDKQESGSAFSLCSARCSKPECGAETCIGCGNGIRTKKFTAVGTNGFKLDWCCEDGRLFAFWVALCKYDELELQQQMQSAATVAAHAAQGHSKSKGTGYTSSERPSIFDLMAQPSYSMAIGGGWSGGHIVRGHRTNHSLNFQQSDEKTDPTIAYILSVIIELFPLPADEGKSKKRVPPAQHAMIQLSLLLDKVAGMLRNDSLRNVSTRNEVYYNVIEFVNRLGKRDRTMYLICDQRYTKKRSSGLQVLSARESFTDAGKGEQPLVLGTSKDDMASSVMSCMTKLALQAKQICEQTNDNKYIRSEFGTEQGTMMLKIASRINKIYGCYASSSHENQKQKPMMDNDSLWAAYHEKHRVDHDSAVSHLLSTLIGQEAGSVSGQKKGWMRRIVSEQVEMITGLPQYIFLKTHDSSPHIMKCLIIGPEGTPYEGGLFEFEILCRDSYPEQPPLVRILTTGRGTVWFNPNLYANGKVCLSLLGTWEGPPESKWQPKLSTIQSVLCSIQAMILNANPLENEPQRDNASINDKKTNHDYNHLCQALTLRFAILDWLERSEMRNGIWKDVVAHYFRYRGDRVLATARKWASSNNFIEKLPKSLRGGSGGEFSSSALWFNTRVGPYENLLKGLEYSMSSIR